MSENLQTVRQSSENDENAFAARNRGKEGANNAAARRPALGTITNKGGRVQPGRAAKVTDVRRSKTENMYSLFELYFIQSL